MQPNSEFILTLVAGAIMGVESMAMSCWAKWPFRGPRLWRRIARVDSSNAEFADLDQLISRSEIIKQIGLRFKEQARNQFLVQIPPRASKMQDQPVFPSFLTGRIELDLVEGVVVFTIRLMPGALILYTTPLVLVLQMMWKYREFGMMVFVFLLWCAFLAAIYFFAYKEYLDDFWYQVTTKLGATSQRNH